MPLFLWGALWGVSNHIYGGDSFHKPELRMGEFAQMQSFHFVGCEIKCVNTFL